MLGIMFAGNVIGPFVFLPIRLRYLTPPIGYPVVFSCFSKTLFTSVADQCDFLAYLFSCQLHFLHVLKLAVVYIHATVALPWVLRYKAKADSAAQELKKKSIPLKKSENSNACTLSCKFMQIGLSLSLSSIILVGSLWSTKPLNWTNLMCQHEVLKAKKVRQAIVKICQFYLRRRVAGLQLFTPESLSTLKASKHERKVN